MAELIEQAKTVAERRAAKRRKVQHRTLTDFERQAHADRVHKALSEPDRCVFARDFLARLRV